MSSPAKISQRLDGSPQGKNQAMDADDAARRDVVTERVDELAGLLVAFAFALQYVLQFWF
jgi:hypothetical protein